MSFFNSTSHTPSATDLCIRIPLSKSTKKFDRSAYSSVISSNKASSEEIDQILSHLETITNRFPTPSQALKTYFRIFIFPWIIINLPKVFSGLDGPHIVKIYIIYALIMIYFLINKNQHKRNHSKLEAMNIIKLYQSAFLAKGLRWLIPKDFPDLIELHKEYRDTSRSRRKKRAHIHKEEIEIQVLEDSKEDEGGLHQPLLRQKVIKILKV